MDNQQLYSDIWSYDISRDTISRGQEINEDVISQSLTTILTTLYGERLFLPAFGSSLSTTIFENLDENSGEHLLDSLIEEIEVWEDRIIIDNENCSLKINNQEQSMIINIPYFIYSESISGSFEKKITF